MAWYKDNLSSQKVSIKFSLRACSFDILYHLSFSHPLACRVSASCRLFCTRHLPARYGRSVLSKMATLSRTSSKLLKKVQYSPILTRNFSNEKLGKQITKVFTTCACVFSGGLAYYAAQYYGRRNTVFALKAKVSHFT